MLSPCLEFTPLYLIRVFPCLKQTGGALSVAKDEVFFAVDEVVAHDQPIRMVVAETKIIAQKAARAVEVLYEDLEPRILTIEEAIENGSFHPKFNLEKRYVVHVIQCLIFSSSVEIVKKNFRHPISAGLNTFNMTSSFCSATTSE
jgi:CO/xanthine dehydrogenase Mo-binding subunit